jgi:pyrimidine deaminase RibD-like protein/predicted nucleotidyltransferase
MKDTEVSNYKHLDAVLVHLCQAVVDGQHSEKDFGLVAACVMDPDHRIALGINSPGPDGHRRHAERVALDNYHKKYGAVPDGSIIVTTLSPCNEYGTEMANSRYGESCTDLINASNIKKVYCGYKDPSQHDQQRAFSEVETSNLALRKICKSIADEFLEPDAPDFIGMMSDFLPMATKIIGIELLPKIKLVKEIPPENGQPTFGYYDADANEMVLGIANRHPLDIIRTLSHELTHFRQDHQGNLNYGDGETGSTQENEANAVAGVVMREFGRAFPKYYKSKPVMSEGTNVSESLVGDNVKYHSELNPLAWENRDLKPQVQKQLLKTALFFTRSLDIPNFKVLDVVLTGSMANYNYTKFSDFDVHVITNYSDLACDDLVEKFYSAKKKIWNSEHDITIYGHEVEMYVEDAASPAVSNAVYSLLKGAWIKEPTQENPVIDDAAINAKTRDLIKQIDVVLQSADEPEDIIRIVHKLKQMRQSGLDQHGEFGVENLSFKILRNLGYIEKLHQSYLARQDQELSIQEQGVPEGAMNFEEGDCPIFAIALHRLSKLPLMALVEYDEQMGSAVLIHAYVKLDDRWRIDATGETDVDWMLQKYPNNGNAEEIEISEKDLIKLGYGKNKCPALQQVLPRAKEVLQTIDNEQGVAENFADGKHPEDKGDSKRHGINTKASISSLRKTAKQGGRKGQLAHWLANMKAGRAKAKK